MRQNVTVFFNSLVNQMPSPIYFFSLKLTLFGWKDCLLLRGDATTHHWLIHLPLLEKTDNKHFLLLIQSSTQNWCLNLCWETELHLGSESSGGYNLNADYIMFSPPAEDPNQSFCPLFCSSKQTWQSRLVHDTYPQSPISGRCLHHTLLQRGEMQGIEAGENTVGFMQRGFL